MDTSLEHFPFSPGKFSLGSNDRFLTLEHVRERAGGTRWIPTGKISPKESSCGLGTCAINDDGDIFIILTSHQQNSHIGHVARNIRIPFNQRRQECLTVRKFQRMFCYTPHTTNYQQQNQDVR
ncbi:hypothetical protein OUZ56_026728 [Daphnia magna]|uniref:Uncharacterized protein n=1 Tax=Daphnia magna TaxID=35525 RepID=A0ABQ9ZMR7_9CRUS|nr:hypothetical protein OUZ56_026728 [Daphnia magna]